MSECDEFDIENEEEISTETDATPRPSTASIFWEEFKYATRSYSETDECSIAMQRSMPSAFLELLFYYLSAVTGLSVTSETMHSKIFIFKLLLIY